MNSRRVVILFIAALLVIAGAIWISSQRHLTRDVTVGQTLLPDLKKALDNINEVRIAKADGEHATLKKSGNVWMVDERHFAADTGKVRKLLLDLSSLEIVEGKTSNPASYATINVEDVPQANPGAASSATRIDLMMPGKTWAVIAGKSDGYKNGYVRLVDSKQSFLATPHIEADAQPQRWLEHTLVAIPQERIQSVAMKSAKGPAYSVSREKKEQQNFTVSNIPPKRKLSYEGAGNSLAGGLANLSLDDVRKKPDPPSAPPATTTVELSQVTYRTFDGLTVTVFGRNESTPGLKPDDSKIDKFFITLAASSDQKATQAEGARLSERVAGQEFEISSYEYAALFKPMEELLEALPSKPAKTAGKLVK